MLITSDQAVSQFIFGFMPFKFKNGAYELTAGDVLALVDYTSPRVIDYKSGDKLHFVQLTVDGDDNSYLLQPSKHCIVKVRERLTLPKDVYAVGYSLKGLTQAGLNLVGTPLFHSGYNGVPDFAMHNLNADSYYKLYREQPVVQLQFFKTQP